MFRENRARLFARLGDQAAVFFAAPELIRNNDVHYDYRQDSDFYWLTGFEEPGSVLVLNPMRPEGQQVQLFLRPRDLQRVVWDGEMLGVERAVETLGVEQAHDIGTLAKGLPEALVGATGVYFDLGKRADDDAVLVKALVAARRHRRMGHDTPGDVRSPEPLLHELRLVRSEAEIAHMRAAAELAAAGHCAGMAVTAPGEFEYRIQAELEYRWAQAGSRRTAYNSIVGSGPNACVLHYRPNDRRMADGDLVLVDAGCELNYFASDITRTWPVNGRFSPAQRAVYEVVLAAQLAAIARCRAGVPFDAVHQAALRVLTEGMVSLGLLQGDVATLIAEEKFKRYYMHRTSHWLGMDVHDVGAYHLRGTSRAFEPGMVLTVEPGLYIAPDDAEAPEHLRGIGVRIEDDVLITTGEPEVLTHGVPKTVEAIEALVGSGRRTA